MYETVAHKSTRIQRIKKQAAARASGGWGGKGMRNDLMERRELNPKTAVQTAKSRLMLSWTETKL